MSAFRPQIPDEIHRAMKGGMKNKINYSLLLAPVFRKVHLLRQISRAPRLAENSRPFSFTVYPMVHYVSLGHFSYFIFNRAHGSDGFTYTRTKRKKERMYVCQ